MVPDCAAFAWLSRFCFPFFFRRYPYYLAATLGVSPRSLPPALLLPALGAAVGSVLAAAAADPRASLHGRRRPQRSDRANAQVAAATSSDEVRSESEGDDSSSSSSSGVGERDQDEESSLDSSSDRESWKIVASFESLEASQPLPFTPLQRRLQLQFQGQFQRRSQRRNEARNSSGSGGDDDGDGDDSQEARRQRRKPPPPPAPCSPLVSTHLLPALVCAALASVVSSAQPQGAPLGRSAAGGVALAVALLRGLHASTVRVCTSCMYRRTWFRPSL